MFNLNTSLSCFMVYRLCYQIILIMNFREVKDAVINQQRMVWNDPDPIEGNDYTVQKIWNIDEETAMIQYGEDDSKYLSEAEVYLTELALK